jgi:hypothetical protein
MNYSLVPAELLTVAHSLSFGVVLVTQGLIHSYFLSFDGCST